ncbi:uncharacterized protein V6R79_006302 [Siganus canaliculatus]
MLLIAEFWTCATALLCLCLRILGLENEGFICLSAQKVDRVFVKEGSDVVLRCSSGNQDLTSALFDWRKEVPNGRQEVFMYDAGDHYNNGLNGQDPQFKGRVSHFEDELQHGNASIKIHNTKLEDSGDYTCYFPRLQRDQTFYVELVVGATPATSVKIVNATNDWALLQCDVRGASPKPTVEWKNSDGKVLHSQKPQVTESEGRYDVTVLITVYETGYYRCVVTQEELHHHAETFIYISAGIRGGERSASVSPWIWITFGAVIGGFITAVAMGILPRVYRKRFHDRRHCGFLWLQFNFWTGGGGFERKERGSRLQSLQQLWRTMFLKPEFWTCAAALLCLYPTILGLENGLKVNRVFVIEGRDVVLRCSSGNQDLTYEVFDWKNEDQKEVFFYDAGVHYNNGGTGQDPQFKGRVSHFEGELQHGNASIKIHNTKMEDSGDYSCYVPRLDQIVRVELVVGVTPATSVKTVNATDDWALLQCDVRGASPKPLQVEWKNSDGKVLHSQKPQVTESEGRYDVTVLTTVYETGLYRCVVTQEELHHQIHAETYVYISAGIRGGIWSASLSPWIWIIFGVVIGGFITAVAMGILPHVYRKRCSNGGGGFEREERGSRLLSLQQLWRTMFLKPEFWTCATALLCLYPTILGLENGPSHNRVFVEEGSDVVLRCSSGNQDLTAALFDWRKEVPNGRQEVFLYDAGVHYNNGRVGQDPQFKGRVSHFEDELQHGNASIKIHNTKMEDSGDYTCYFPRLDQTFRVKLVVGVTPATSVKTVNASDDWALLQCDVRGASPKPTVEWKNSDGKVLHSQEPEVTESEGQYDVTVLTTVYQTGHYRCVVIQKELHHQVHAETYVYISAGIRGAIRCKSESPWSWTFLGVVIGVFITAVAMGILPRVYRKRFHDRVTMML